MACVTDSSIPEVSMERNIILRARNPVRCLVVGPEACGKTGLVSALIRELKEILGKLHFKSSSAFCVTRAMQYQCVGSSNSLTLVDLPGDFKNVTGKFGCFTNINMICYCYAINACYNLGDLAAWIRELSMYLPGVPSILVACKNDLREREYRQHLSSTHVSRLIPSETGLDFQMKHKIDKFYEFSDKDSPDAIRKILAGMFELVRIPVSEAPPSRRNDLTGCCSIL